LTFGPLLLISQKLRQAAVNLATAATLTSNSSQRGKDNFSNWHFSAMIAVQHAAIKANRIMLLAIASNSNNNKQINICCGSNEEAGKSAPSCQWPAAKNFRFPAKKLQLEGGSPKERICVEMDKKKTRLLQAINKKMLRLGICYIKFTQCNSSSNNGIRIRIRAKLYIGCVILAPLCFLPLPPNLRV